MSNSSRTRRTPSLVAGLLALAVAAPLVPASVATAATTATTPAVAAPSSPLPFDLPAASVLRSSPRKAFAHYVPWFPVSLDNKAPDYYDRNYLTTTGENGKHAAYGGYLRDRPARRPVSADPAYKLRDLETEVRQAVAGGLDGFAVDILQLGDTGGTQWTAVNQLLQAATTVDRGFRIMLMPDMTGSGMSTKTPAVLAKYMAQLGASPAAHRLPDGRLVISPFTAERKTVAYWTEFLAIMKSTYATPVAFLPLFQDERQHRSTYASISYGMSNWGNRNPAWNNPTATGSDSPLGRAAAVRSLGKAWMQPVSVQDQRPHSGIFDEAENTQNLRNTWQIARSSGAELVQIPTWNDYAEGTQLAPSGQNGPAWLDLSSYYLTWYKTGSAPVIVRDAVYLTHRGQPNAARPTYAQTLLMSRRGTSSSVPRDTVEALTFLTAPGRVRVTVGSTSHVCDVDAGVDTCTVPLAPGSVSAVVERGGAPVTKVTSPRTVTTSPYVQDLQYVASSSGRQTGAAELRAADAAPSTPTGLAVDVDGSTHRLTWSAATDDWGVAGYDVHRSGTASFTPDATTRVVSTAGTTATLGEVPVGTWYYRVVARDTAGQLGAPSSPLTAAVADTTAPSAPASVSADVRDTTVALAWSASTDDTAVRSYEVHRSTVSGFSPSSTTLVAGTTSTSWSQTAAAGTWYYRVVATDAADNRSTASTQVSAVVAAPVAATTTTVVVRPSADSYANEGAPSSNFGSSSSLASRGGVDAITYLRFAIPAAPAGKTLTSAALRIRTTGETFAGSAQAHRIVLAGDAWTETGVTWKVKPATTTQVLGTIAAGAGVNDDVTTALATSAVRALTGTTRTLAVTATGSDNLWFWSRNHANTSYGPQLVLTYS